MLDPKNIIEEYRGHYICDSDRGAPYREYMAFPITDGQAEHDYDYDGERYRYCGNSFFGDVDDLKDQIDESIQKQMPCMEDMAYNTTESGFNESKFNEAFGEWEAKFATQLVPTKN